jgi:hypothetical protein
MINDIPGALSAGRMRERRDRPPALPAARG